MVELMTGAGVAGPILLTARSMGLCSTAPILSTPRLPSRLRFALALLLAAPAFFLIPVRSLALSGGKAILISSVVVELLVGALLGFTATLVFEAYRTLGAILDLRSSLVAARGQSPIDDADGGPLARLAYVLALLVFIMLDGHHLLLRALAGSITALPLANATSDVLVGSGVPFLLQAGHCFFSTALRFALPALFLLFVVELFLALIGHTFPSLRDVAGDRSLRTMTGLGVSLLTLYVTVQWVLPYITKAFTEIGIPILPLNH